jgi:hypothetical protein
MLLLKNAILKKSPLLFSFMFFAVLFSCVQGAKAAPQTWISYAPIAYTYPNGTSVQIPRGYAWTVMPTGFVYMVPTAAWYPGLFVPMGFVY